VHTKRKRPTAKLIIPAVGRGHGVTFDTFSDLIRKHRLDKIENALAIVSPSEGFRASLLTILWRFYLNSLPEARARSSRAALKRELRRSADLADRLQASAEILWKSGEPSVEEILEDFNRPLTFLVTATGPHESGVDWIASLDEFAKRTRLLADTLSDDKGGRRNTVAFDDLLLGLADYYGALARDRQQPIVERQFSAFAAATTDVLRNVAPKLRAAAFDLPKTDKALRERLRRVTKRQKRSGT
jgi:hypothetical protein